MCGLPEPFCALNPVGAKEGLRLPSVVAASLEEEFTGFFLGDGLDPFGGFAACPSDVIMVPGLQCFCADLENSDVGV